MNNINLQVEVFKGKEASVNSYIFNNGHSIVVMDLLRNSKEALDLAKFVKAKNLPVTHLLISHGHPDHYIGIEVLSKEFPTASIVVATEDIKNDIIGFSNWMDSIGWLEGEPKLKPLSEKNPSGFDYKNKIQSLETNELKLQGGGSLEIKTQYLAAEAEHLTTIFSKDLNALFTSDFCYNGVHLWLGQGVDQDHITNWKKELSNFKASYQTSDVTIYPGHGEASTPALFDVVLKYLEGFEKTIQSSETKEEAQEKMIQLYPDWEEADFLLRNSVNYHMDLKVPN